MKLTLMLLVGIPCALFAGTTPSAVTLNSSPNPSVYGLTATLTASVSPSAATGDVTFYDGPAVLGTAKLTAGQATLATILLSAGARSLKVYYGGDATFAPSSSARLAQTVNAAPGGGFQAALSFGAGVRPNAVAVGDFNGDGKADLAVANTGSGNISVLTGIGDGTFKPNVNYSAGSGPNSIAVGDFNGDGKQDLAVANSGGNVSVLLGNGDGTFQPAVNHGAGSGADSVAIGDFNGDGNADIAVANSGGNVSVLLGNGDGTFQSAMNFAAGTTPESIAVGDFNNDGKADLAVANEGSTNVSVLLGNGDGTFRAAVNYGAGWQPQSIVVGDFNGDGNPDIATGNYQYDVSVLLGKGDGTFQPAVSYLIEGYGNFVALGDFNGDGKPDLAVSNIAANSVTVLLGKGDGTFFPPETNYSAGAAPRSIAVADLSGNGQADLVTANPGENGVRVLLAAAAFPELLTIVSHSGNFGQGQSGATYRITISNVGSAPTSGIVTVTDSLPPGVTAVSIGGTGWTCVLTTLTCTRQDSLATAMSYPIILLPVTVGPGASGGITNTVQVSGGAPANIANGTARDFTTTFTSTQFAQAWSPLKPPTLPSGYGFSAALLMTDGTVMVNESCAGNWYRLTPDIFGSYVNGTWSQAASMPAGYAPSDFSSAVLADGRLVVIGGEYNSSGAGTGCGAAVWTKLGAIYDPATNVWSPLSAPTGWTSVGDAPNVVLPDGHFLLGSLNSQVARLDPATLTWTILNVAGKADSNDEEGWTLLPDGTILTVDVRNGSQTERYSPSTNSWQSAGNTVAPLATIIEMGPQVLRPNGTVFAAGPTGHTGVYNVATGTWAAGPDLPVSNGQQLFTDDGPASLLPSGNVLMPASGYFFEFDGTNLNSVPSVGGCGSLLLLPTGQALCSAYYIYTATGSPDPAWAPAIATAPGMVQPGMTYGITGTQFNGLSQAVGYGDDYQGATNYPLVRITNTATGHVFYCRTHNHSTMAVATGAAPVSTQFDVPATIEMGPSTLVVVANGIASSPSPLTVAAAGTITISNVQDAESARTSVTSGQWTAIYGMNLANTTRFWSDSDFTSGTSPGSPLPTMLDGVRVTIGGFNAAVYYVSPAQLNVLTPSSLPLGPVPVVVTNNGAVSSTFMTTVVASSPSFFYYAAGGAIYPLAVHLSDGKLVGDPAALSNTEKAHPGEILEIYANGLAASPGGVIAAVTPFTPTVTVTAGSTPLPGLGAALLYAGEFQVNVQLPPSLPAGTYTLTMTVPNGSTSTSGVTVILPVGP